VFSTALEFLPQNGKILSLLYSYELAKAEEFLSD